MGVKFCKPATKYGQSGRKRKKKENISCQPCRQWKKHSLKKENKTGEVKGGDGIIGRGQQGNSKLTDGSQLLGPNLKKNLQGI